MELENGKNLEPDTSVPTELNEEELDEVVGGNDQWYKKGDIAIGIDSNPASLISNPVNRITHPVDIPGAKRMGQQY